jgi:RNA polymerase sigma factor (sigma-70 family)
MSVTLPPFQQLVDAYWRDVARLAHSLAGPGEGDDVAQQSWTQALAAYPRLQSAANLRSWLLTITARCAMDGHRSRARRPVPVDSVPEPSGPSKTAPGADHVALQSDPQLWAQVRSLPPRQREAIALRYVADLDHAAVASAMGTTPAATRRLVSDALAALRSEVDA